MSIYQVRKPILIHVQNTFIILTHLLQLPLLKHEAGPCILGATVNKMFGKHPQTSFHVGDLDASSSRDLNIPGRVVILDGNKADMGAFRFTFTEKNLIVAATDMPDFEDKPTDRKNHHYSLSSKKGKLYGLRGIYKNSVVAHEKIRFELSL